MLATDPRLTAALQSEIDRYVKQGYRVVSQTPTTAQLVKPKKFNFLIALFGLLWLTIGFWIYLLWYLAQREKTVYLTVDAKGRVHPS